MTPLDEAPEQRWRRTVDRRNRPAKLKVDRLLRDFGYDELDPSVGEAIEARLAGVALAVAPSLREASANEVVTIYASEPVAQDEPAPAPAPADAGVDPDADAAAAPGEPQAGASDVGQMVNYLKQQVLDARAEADRLRSELDRRIAARADSEAEAQAIIAEQAVALEEQARQIATLGAALEQTRQALAETRDEIRRAVGELQALPEPEPSDDPVPADEEPPEEESLSGVESGDGREGAEAAADGAGDELGGEPPAPETAHDARPEPDAPELRAVELDIAAAETVFDDPGLGAELPAPDRDEPAPGEELSALELDERALGEELSALELDEAALGEELSALELDEAAPGEELSALELDEPAPGEELPALELDEPAAGEELPALELDEPAPADELAALELDEPPLGAARSSAPPPDDDTDDDDALAEFDLAPAAPRSAAAAGDELTDFDLSPASVPDAEAAPSAADRASDEIDEDLVTGFDDFLYDAEELYDPAGSPEASAPAQDEPAGLGEPAAALPPPPPLPPSPWAEAPEPALHREADPGHYPHEPEPEPEPGPVAPVERATIAKVLRKRGGRTRGRWQGNCSVCGREPGENRRKDLEAAGWDLDDTAPACPQCRGIG